LVQLLRQPVQIELRRGVLHRERIHLDRVQTRGRGRGVLKCEHHLEQRRPAQAALRLQLLHQPVERKVLVVERPQAALSYPLQQLQERRVTTEIAAYRQGDFYFWCRPLKVGRPT
jgi:hypothetical protein